MLRTDLEAAEIPYRNGSGRVCDFHALRHTYVSNIVRNGASVRVCQEHPSHSDPKLTLGIYTHLQVLDKTKALDGLPSMKPDRPEREAGRATSTNDVKAFPMIDPVPKLTVHMRRAGAPKGNSMHSHAMTSSMEGDANKSLLTKDNAVLSRPENTYAPVAQWIEQRSSKPQVAGSNPARRD